MSILLAGTKLLYRLQKVTLPYDVKFALKRNGIVNSDEKMCITDDNLREDIHNQWISIVNEKGYPLYTLKSGVPLMWQMRPFITTREYKVYVIHGILEDESEMEKYKANGKSDGYLIITSSTFDGPNLELHLWDRNSYPEFKSQIDVANKVYNELTYPN